MKRSRWLLVAIAGSSLLAILLAPVGATAGPTKTPCGGNTPQCYLITVTGSGGATYLLVGSQQNATATFTNESSSSKLGSVQWTLAPGAILTNTGPCSSSVASASISTSGNVITISGLNLSPGQTGSVTCPVVVNTAGTFANTFVAQVNPNFTSGSSSNVLTQDPASQISWTVGYGTDCPAGTPCGNASVNHNTTTCSNQTTNPAGNLRMRVCFPANENNGDFPYRFYDATTGGAQPAACTNGTLSCLAIWNGGLLPPGFSAVSPIVLTILARNSGGSTPYKVDEGGNLIALLRCSQSQPPCADRVPGGFEFHFPSSDPFGILGR